MANPRLGNVARMTNAILEAKTPEEQAVAIEALRVYKADWKNASADRPDMEDVSKMLSQVVNGMGREDYEAFVKYWATEHRTLQQALTRLVMAWIKDLAEREHYDGRNEASVMLARKIMAALPDGYGLPVV